MKPLFSLMATLVSLAVASPVHAAGEREIRLRVVSLQQDGGGDVFVHDAAGSGAAGVRLTPKSFLNHESETFQAGGSAIVFTNREDTASVQDASAVLGKAELAKGQASMIVLVVPGVDKEKAEVVTLDDSAKAFPPASIRLLNLGDEAVRIEVEKKPFDFAAGASGLIEDPPVGEAGSSGMEAFRKDGETWTRFVSSIWPHPGRKRVLQVILRNPVTKQLEIRGIRDVATVGE